jgi:hypothetical protein
MKKDSERHRNTPLKSSGPFSPFVPSTKKRSDPIPPNPTKKFFLPRQPKPERKPADHTKITKRTHLGIFDLPANKGDCAHKTENAHEKRTHFQGSNRQPSRFSALSEPPWQNFPPDFLCLKTIDTLNLGND